MSSAILSQIGGAHEYFCYQCERHVTIAPRPQPPPTCFAPAAKAAFVFGAITADDFLPNAGDDSSESRSPFSSLINNLINNPQARGTNVELVFESTNGGDFRNLGGYFVGHGFEQLVQQLADNDPDRGGTPPASKSAVEGLPEIKITQELLDSDPSQCAVCNDCFELKEEAKQMPCKHFYHKDCILPWLKMHNSCPVCRFELPTDDPEYENRGINDSSSSNNNDNGQLMMELRERMSFPVFDGPSNSGAGVEDLD